MALRATERDPLAPLAASALMMTSSGALVFTLLAALQDRSGFSDLGLGVIAFSYFATSLFAQIGLARFADRGHARRLMVIGVVLAVAALIWFAVAESLVALVLARAVGGLGFGCWEPAAKAVVLAGRAEDVGRRLGIMTAASTGGIVVGPVVGAFLYEGTDSLVLPFLLFAVILLPILVVSAVLPIGEGDRQGPTSESTRPGELLRRRAVQRSVLVAIALLMPVGMYEVIWARLLTDLGASTWLIGISVAVYGLPFLLVAPIGGWIGDRLGVERVSGIGAIVVSGVILLMGQPKSIGLLLAVGVIEAIVNAIAIPNAYASMAKACRSDEQATGQGLIGGVGLASSGLLALFAGWLYAEGGQRLVFTFTAALVLIVALLAQLLGRQDPQGSGSGGRSPVDAERVVDKGQLQS